MSKVKIDNRLPQFKSSLHKVMADALNEGARDTLITAKTRAPYRTGGLRSDSQIQRKGPLSYWVSFYKEYARFQEYGGDTSRRIRNYTTAGTGKGFLKTSGDEQAARIVNIYKKHAGRARA